MELFNRKDIKREAHERLTDNYIMAIIVLLVTYVIDKLVSSSLVSSIVLFILFTIISAIVKLATTKMYIGISRSNTEDIPDLLRFGLNNVLKYIGLMIIILVATSIGFLLLIVPGIIVAVRLQFAPMILCDNTDISIKEAIKKSWEITEGQTWNLVVLNLSFILWIMLIIVTVGIASLYVTPYMTTTTTICYNKLSGYKEETN